MKIFVLVMPLLMGTVLYAGVKAIEAQVNKGVYSVFCTNEKYGTVSKDNGIVCVSGNGKSKCSHEWNINTAATWMCKDSSNKKI